jgi:NADPH:quinone reductase-like Zn-dependent oxidoreductase
MKAYVLRSYGAPDHLELTEIARPVPGDDEVLIRVRATNVQPWDWHLMRGEPRLSRLMGGPLGVRTPKIRVLGADVAGVVEAAGARVTGFRPGDEVFAMPKGGGFAEYVCVPERDLAPKPASLSFEQAAAVPLAALTAQLAVRDQGGVGPGRHVLVNGASGGVGTFAVQLAKAYGGRVTAVCSGRNAGLVRRLGADEVIDHTEQDFTRPDVIGPDPARDGRRYDVFIDIAGSRPVSAGRRLLPRHGAYVLVGGPGRRWLQPMGRMLGALATRPFVPQRLLLTDVIGSTATRQNLLTLTDLIEKGELTPVIDGVYPFAEIPAALRRAEEGHVAGKLVITVSEP